MGRQHDRQTESEKSRSATGRETKHHNCRYYIQTNELKAFISHFSKAVKSLRFVSQHKTAEIKIPKKHIMRRTLVAGGWGR